MKKNRGTTKKKYGDCVTPQNDPAIGIKRLLHFLLSLFLIINLIILARLLPDIRNQSVALAFVFIFYAIIQQIDRRKSNWAWWAIVFFSFFSFALPVWFVLSFDLDWYLAVIALQMTVSAAIFFIYRKK